MLKLPRARVPGGAEVCRRAVTEEEMQRVVESTMKIGPGRPAPKYDPSYKCPLEAQLGILLMERDMFREFMSR